MYFVMQNHDKIPQLEQELARDRFQVFQGLRGAAMLDTQILAGIFSIA